MKILRSVLGLACLVVMLFSLGTNLSSCQKEIITDTVYIKDTINHTINHTDTVHIVDSSSCSCYDLMDGLVAYYNFNNGNLEDSSGNGNNIILNNNAVKTTDRYGRPDNAYLFNGADSYMKVANSASLNMTKAITLTATIKINGWYSANCVSNQIVGKGWDDNASGFYELRFFSQQGCNHALDTSKEIVFGSYGDFTGRAADYDTHYIHSGRWYNLVYTYGDGESKVYIDGILQSTVASAAPSFTPNTQELLIGKTGDAVYPYLFNGVIDEVRIYNKALCEAAVKQLYSTKQ